MATRQEAVVELSSCLSEVVDNHWAYEIVLEALKYCDSIYDLAWIHGMGENFRIRGKQYAQLFQSNETEYHHTLQLSLICFNIGSILSGIE